MRDIERIQTTTAVLRDLWHEYPDMRFGQLVYNLTRLDPLFEIEDDKLVEIARRVRREGWEAGG